MSRNDTEKMTKRWVVAAAAAVIGAGGFYADANEQATETEEATAVHKEERTVSKWRANEVSEVKEEVETQQSADNLSYHIQWGDTLWALSQATGMSVDELAQVNNIWNPDLIFANDYLEGVLSGAKEARPTVDKVAQEEAAPVVEEPAAEPAPEVELEEEPVVEEEIPAEEPVIEEEVPVEESETKPAEEEMVEEEPAAEEQPETPTVEEELPAEEEPVEEEAEEPTVEEELPTEEEPAEEESIEEAPVEEEPAEEEPIVEEELPAEEAPVEEAPVEEEISEEAPVEEEPVEVEPAPEEIPAEEPTEEELVSEESPVEEEVVEEAPEPTEEPELPAEEPAEEEPVADVVVPEENSEAEDVETEEELDVEDVIVSEDIVEPQDNIETEQDTAVVADPNSHTDAWEPFIWPAQGYVSSDYGYRIHPVTGERALHAGIDIAGGGLVYAAQGGTVVESGYHSGWGNYVKIDHGNGIQTLYAHMQDGTVSAFEGDIVPQGEPIGIMGTTGSSTGVHLHFEVHVDGVQVDPAPYLYMNL